MYWSYNWRDIRDQIEAENQHFISFNMILRNLFLYNLHNALYPFVKQNWQIKSRCVNVFYLQFQYNLTASIQSHNSNFNLQFMNVKRSRTFLTNNKQLHEPLFSNALFSNDCLIQLFILYIVYFSEIKKIFTKDKQ